MKQPFNMWAIAAVAALSMPLANTVYAETRTAPDSAVQPLLLAADDTVDEAGGAVSDTWITSKVKSSFLADKDISGLDIKVETNQGVVSLSGTVNTEAEKNLAVEKARSIEGVRDVSADGLKTAQ